MRPQPLSAEAEAAAQQESAWQLLLAARRASAAGDGATVGEPPWLRWQGAECHGASEAAPAAARALLDLYAPLCAAGPGRSLTLAHLGQSLDGHIATSTGDSYYVTGPDNVRHLHRLRALCDAVIVGAGTVARDDPQLTVRHVEGANPVRVILDSRGQLAARHRVFTDGQARTLVVHAEGERRRSPGAAEVVQVPVSGARLRLDALLVQLHARGLWSVFVEGGGATVSGFLEAALLDRLHVAIAPLVTGGGRPGLTLPARDRIADCLRPQHRIFTMGGDVLFDCDLRAPAVQAAVEPSDTLTRVV
jgi:riboflavin-specific deaminase-like protein